MVGGGRTIRRRAAYLLRSVHTAAAVDPADLYRDWKTNIRCESESESESESERTEFFGVVRIGNGRRRRGPYC